MREAVRRLEAEGYLTSRPNRGAMVSKYTAEQLLEVFEIRTALECLAVGIATPQLRPEDFARLEKLLDAMSSAGDSTNILGSPSIRSPTWLSWAWRDDRAWP